jgi:hypothetical protein
MRGWNLYLYEIEAGAECLAFRPQLYFVIEQVQELNSYPSYGLFGTSRARPRVAQALAAQVIGVNNFEFPGLPSGVDREAIGKALQHRATRSLSTEPRAAIPARRVRFPPRSP